MEIRFDGKTALVTGSGRGIGRAIAKRLVECGAKTYALSIFKDELDSLKEEVPEIHTIQVDLRDWKKTREEVEKLEAIDLLVNNAGVYKMNDFLTAPQDELNEMMDVNFNAGFNVSQVVAKKMIEKKIGGSIVFISSIGSTIAMDKMSVYSCTKSAIDMLTKCMALELGPHKIRVNSVNPTVVWTEMALKIKDHINKSPTLSLTPLGKFADKDDIVNTVLFLLSDKSGMIHGESIRIDGGLGVH
ncbi:L-xylulose reductase [Mytilus galloprovincialis]|uniref:L-xylulose reductase n=1 Tax=Mytilus galloprovincialis TaxID=29158 RepID=A0A8B6D5V6_MYTGA|nr:L-xylulose reductase [Mytilus galloprovincialis]